MDDIARAAGVGRTTVFRRFDSKDRLVQTVMLRVVGQATKRVQAVFESARDLETGLTEALVTSVKELRDHPLFAKVLRIEPESFLRMLTTDGVSVIAVVRGSIADWLGASGGAFGGGSNVVPPTLGNFGGRADFDVLAYWTLENFSLGNLAIQKRRRAEVGAYIAAVVDRWDTETLVQRLELQVGSDLQYIRINGTLVGGLVGLLIFTLSRAFGG